MKKATLRFVASLLFLWASGFIAWNFYGLCLHSGELVIAEPVTWVRWFEFGLACLITIYALVYSFWHWFEIKI